MRERLKSFIEIVIFYLAFQRVDIIEKLVLLWKRTIGPLLRRRRHPLSVRCNTSLLHRGNKINKIKTLQDICIQGLVENIDSLDSLSIYKLSPDLAQMLFDRISLTRMMNINIINIFSCQFLDHVDLGYQHFATDAWLVAFNKSPLTALDISYGGMISNEGLKNVKNYKLLQDLSLNYCSEIFDATFECLVGLRQLKKLSMKGCNQFRGSGLKFITNLTNLEILDMEMCRSLDRGLHNLKFLTLLRELNLGWCSKLPQKSRKHLQLLKNLTKLNISQTKLADDIDFKQIHFPSLKSLSLSGGAFYQDGLSSLPELNGLEQLDIDRCYFPHATVHYLSKMKSLKCLNIGCTKIKNKNLAYIANIPNLTHLNMETLTITNRGFSSLNSLHHLQYLNVEYTRVGNSSMKIILNFKNLKVLNLAYTEVDNEGLSGIHSLKLLNDLNLDSRKFSDGAIKYIKGMTQLTKLDMFSALVTDVGIRGLKNCINLKSLEMCGGKLTDSCFCTLSSLTNLTHLSLAQNSEICAPEIDEITTLQDLQSLNFSGTNVRGGFIVQLSFLKNLLCLSLYNTNVTKVAANKLREVLPMVQIIGKNQ